MPIPPLPIDDRRYDDLVREMRALIPRYAPEWTDHLPSDPGIMLLELFSWLTEMLIYRESRVTDASRRRFVELLGAKPQPAQAAQAELHLAVSGLGGKLVLPRGTPLVARRTGLEKPAPFETTADLELVPESTTGVVTVRQSRFVSKERLGVGNGEPNQVFPLGHAYVYYGDADSCKDLVATVGETEWSYDPDLWKPSGGVTTVFAVDSGRNAVRFGAGGRRVAVPPEGSKAEASVGAIPAKGLPILASYHVTLGSKGNLPGDVDYALDFDSPQLASVVRDARRQGVQLDFTPAGAASGGRDPSTLEELYAEIVHDLAAPWRTVTKQDFVRFVCGLQDVNIARASCHAERNLEAATPEDEAAGHVSVVIVPGRPPERPGKPVGTGQLPEGPADYRTNDIRLCGPALPGAKPASKESRAEPGGCILASPDGKQVARLWRGGFAVLAPEKGEQAVELPAITAVTCVAFGPEGRYLAWASGDNIVRLWDVQKERMGGAPLFADGRAITSLAFSPDGRSLAAGTRSGGLLQWDVETRQAISPAIPVLVADAKAPHGWRQLSCDVLSVAFSPDGRYLAFGTEHIQDPQGASLVLVWDRADRRLLYPSAIAAPGVPGLAFSPDSRLLAAACGDGSVLLWDVKSFAKPGPRPRENHPANQPKPHAGGATAVAFSPSGAILASAGKDGRVGLWRVPAPGEKELAGEFVAFGGPVHVTSIGFDPEGATLAAGGLDGALKLCDLQATLREFQTIVPPSDARRAVTSLAFNPDARLRMIVYGGRDGAWRLGEADGATWKEKTMRLSHGDRALWSPERAAFSPDGRWLTLAADENAVQVWDTQSRQQVAELPHAAPVQAIVFRPDGRWLATSAGDRTTHLWEVETWSRFAGVQNEAPAVDVVFSPDGRWFATLGQGGEVELWNSDRRRRVAAWRHDSLAGAAFSPGAGRWLAAFGRNPAVRLFDTWTGHRVDLSLRWPAISQVAFRPGAKRLVAASAGGQFGCWALAGADRGAGDRIPAWQLEWEYDPATSDAARVLPSPDLRWLVVQTDDEREHLQVWDLDAGRVTATLHHDDAVGPVVFGDDGKLVATASEPSRPTSGRAGASASNEPQASMPLVQVWEVQSGRQLAVIDASAEDMRFVANSSRLMTVGRAAQGAAVRVWEANYVQRTVDHLDERRLMTTRPHVVGATYCGVRIKAEVVCHGRANQARLRGEIEENLRAFFDPLKGGPDKEKNGWPYGRDVYASECYQVIESTAGVDHVESLKLMVLQAPDPPAGQDARDRPILQGLRRWTFADGNVVDVAANDLVHLTIKSDDIQVRGAN